MNPTEQMSTTPNSTPESTVMDPLHTGATFAAPIQTNTPVSAPPTVAEPRSFLVTFLLAAFSGPAGLRHLYTGQKGLAITRLCLAFSPLIGILVGLASPVVGGILIILSILPIIVAYVWGAADFFIVYFSVRSDADGQLLTMTKRDKKWADVLFWATIIGVTLYIVLVVVFAALGVFQNSQDSIREGSFQLRSTPL